MGSLLRSQTLPVGLSHNTVINAAKNETFAVVEQRSAFVLERVDADDREIFNEFEGIAAEVIVIA